MADTHDYPSERIVQMCFRFLLDHMVCENGLLDELYSKDVINPREFEKLSKCRGMDSCEQLLLLISRQSRQNYGLFIEALRNVRQAHVADHLVTTEQNLKRTQTKQFALTDVTEAGESAMKSKIQKCRQRIINAVQAFDVCHYLYEKDVISLSDYEEIRTSTVRATQMTLLMDKLSYVDPERFPFVHLRRAMQKRYSELTEEIDKSDQTNVLLDRANKLHEVDMQTGVWGVAVLDSVLYVVLHNSSDIQTYSAVEPYEDLGRIITVEGLGWPVDIVADSALHSVYVSDRYGRKEHGTTPGLYSIIASSSYQFLPLDVTPGGLSLTSDGRLLVICENAKESRSLRFFRGTLEETGSAKNVKLVMENDWIDLAVERYLLQAAQIEKDRFAVSQVHKSTKLHRIVVFDEEGCEVCTFGGVELPHNLMFPWSVLPLCISSCNKLILANDCDNGRILLLRFVDDQLEFCRDVVSASDFCPRRLCVDEARGLLYVGAGCKATKADVRVADSQVSGKLSVWQIINVSV